MNQAALKSEQDAILRAEIESEATNALAELEPLYRWLLDTADARKPMPRWGKRPHFGKIAIEMGQTTKTVGKAYSNIISRWYPRFLESYGRDNIKVHIPHFLPAVVDFGSEPNLDNTAYRASLIRDLQAAKAASPEQQSLAYDWLIQRAEAGASVPTHGQRANIRAIANLMGTGYHVALSFTDIFAFWVPRFTLAPTNSLLRRDRLPGSDRVGTDVPTGMLLKSMRLALKEEHHEDGQRLLAHLIAIAESERTVPRFHGRPARAKIFADAGVAQSHAPFVIQGIYDEWISFFSLSDHYATRSSDGTFHERRVIAEDVRRYVQRLREADMTPLKRDSRDTSAISFRSVNQELLLTGRAVASGEPRRILVAYRDECAKHYSTDGLGDTYTGRPAVEKRERDERRKSLIAYCKKEIDAGRPLPGRPSRPTMLDHAELDRRFNQPGPNLSDDSYFRLQLGRLKPRFAAYDAVAVPQTYGQLITEVLSSRIRNQTEGTKSVLTSRYKTAIESYAGQLGKDVVSQVGDDFSQDTFDKTILAITQNGGVAKTFEKDIRAVRSFLDDRRANMSRHADFASLLSEAVRYSRRSVANIVAGTNLSEGQVNHWIRRNNEPSRSQVEDISKLEDSLKLSRGTLTGKIGDVSFSRSQSPIKLPERVRSFLPDDYMKRDPQEVKAMVKWIDENLVHQNTDFARTMSEFQRRTHAKRKTNLAAAEEDDRNYEAVPGFLDEDDEILSEGEQEDLASGSDSIVARKLVTTALEYHLEHQTAGLGTNVVLELRELITHMTDFVPTNDMLRRPNSHWKHQTTAPMRLAVLARFLRWQVMSEDEGGLGRDPEALTLGDLLHPPLLFAYLDWKVRRHENVEREGRRRGVRFTGSEVDILRTVRALLDPEYGFVTQSKSIANSIQADLRPLAEGAFVGLDGHVFDASENSDADKQEQSGIRIRADEDIIPRSLTSMTDREFQDRCERVSRVYGAAAQQLDTVAEAGRDPAEAIEGLLESTHPMATLLRQLALASHRTPPSSVDIRLHHLHIRDLLLCRLFALTALRQKNMRQMTVDGPSPKLRQEKNKGGAQRGLKTEETQWVIEIHHSEFKNSRNALLFGRRRKRQPYRKFLPDTQGLYKLMDYYLTVSRPYFLARRTTKGKPSLELFLTSTGKPLDGSETWRAVNRFTARHLAYNPFRGEGVPKVMPFGPHAFRDIRATDILLHPRTSNPYLEAALALQTSPGMVQAHYGVIRTERRTAQDDITFLASEKQAWAGIPEPEYA